MPNINVIEEFVFDNNTLYVLGSNGRMYRLVEDYTKADDPENDILIMKWEPLPQLPTEE